MGGAAKSIGNIGGRVLGDVATGGLAEFGKKDPFTGLITNSSTGLGAINPAFRLGGTSNPSIGGPFSLDQNQSAADQAAITGLGQKQYDQTMSEIPKAVGNAVNQQIPGIEEKLNSQHLLNSSALPQEIARQQEYLTQNLAIPAMQQLQGTQTAGLQRGLGLEDYVNEANVAKTIGAQMAPPPPSGKAQAGTAMQGIGAMAPMAKAFK